MTDAFVPSDSGATVERWLLDVGFHFNPFLFLDAGADPNISAYLVGHEAFAAMWGNWPTLAFAPAGGGKTALRVQVTRACWAGPDVGHPFPIPYVPALGPSGRFPASLAGHVAAILQAGALRLLMALLLHPHWWGELDAAARRLVRGLLDCDLPVPLSHYLAQLEEEQRLFPFFSSFAPAELPVGEPEPAYWLPVCGELSRTPVGEAPAAPLERLQTLVGLLTGPLGLSCVYLLIDGIDGFVETTADAQAAISLIAPLLAKAERWAAQNLFLKGFLPIETTTALAEVAPDLSRRAHQVTLAWSVPLLAEVVRQRIYVATRGAYGSLDAICTPGLRDTETHLARAVEPLPREMLVLTGRLLWEHVRRAGLDGKLDSSDLEAALAWYKTQSIPPTPIPWQPPKLIAELEEK